MTSVCARRGKGEDPALEQASDCAACAARPAELALDPPPILVGLQTERTEYAAVPRGPEGSGCVLDVPPLLFERWSPPLRRTDPEAAPRGAPAGPDGAMARGLDAATSVGAETSPLAMPPKGPVTTADRRLPRDPLRDQAHPSARQRPRRPRVWIFDVPRGNIAPARLRNRRRHAPTTIPNRGRSSRVSGPRRSDGTRAAPLSAAAAAGSAAG